MVGPESTSSLRPATEPETKPNPSGTATPLVIGQIPTRQLDLFVLAFPRCLASFVVGAQEQDELVSVGVEEDTQKNIGVAIA